MVCLANILIKPIYQQVFNKEFEYKNFDDRLKMQKLIYLLQELGIGVGDYRFSWYKHGPYSQNLLDDSYISSGGRVTFTPEAEQIVFELAEILNNSVSYEAVDWIECLGSLRYLKSNAKPNSSDEEILAILKTKKSHLNDDIANQEALKKINYLF